MTSTQLHDIVKASVSLPLYGIVHSYNSSTHERNIPRGGAVKRGFETIFVSRFLGFEVRIEVSDAREHGSTFIHVNCN